MWEMVVEGVNHSEKLRKTDLMNLDEVGRYFAWKRNTSSCSKFPEHYRSFLMRFSGRTGINGSHPEGAYRPSLR